MDDKYTSFELSKKLWDNGCRLDFIMARPEKNKCFNIEMKDIDKNILEKYILENNTYPSYDIFWEICVKYSNDFFGSYENQEHIIKRIWDYLIMGHKNRAEIEIWDGCLFNKNNRGK